MQYKFPLNEVATEFFDELKSVSSGYASFDYEDAGYVESDLGKICGTLPNILKKPNNMIL